MAEKGEPKKSKLAKKSKMATKKEEVPTKKDEVPTDHWCCRWVETSPGMFTNLDVNGDLPNFLPVGMPDLYDPNTTVRWYHIYPNEMYKEFDEVRE